MKLKAGKGVAKIEEEVKEEKENLEASGSLVLPCFDFYKNLESLQISDLQFK